MFQVTVSLLVLVATAATTHAQSNLTVVNKCNESVFLRTQSRFGRIRSNVDVAAGASVNMDISLDWDGTINAGTGCNSDGSVCTTGGPTWNGITPFSSADFNFHSIPGGVTYDISLVYGYNVGMEISSADTRCHAFACTIPSGNCPIPGPGGSCYSPCCASAEACRGGALPNGGGGCPNNEDPGPQSTFYYTTCPNVYAYPNGLRRFEPINEVDFTCGNTVIMLTLCPGTTSHYPPIIFNL